MIFLKIGITAIIVFVVDIFLVDRLEPSVKIWANISDGVGILSLVSAIVSFIIAVWVLL